MLVSFGVGGVVFVLVLVIWLLGGVFSLWVLLGSFIMLFMGDGCCLMCYYIEGGVFEVNGKLVLLVVLEICVVVFSGSFVCESMVDGWLMIFGYVNLVVLLLVVFSGVLEMVLEDCWCSFVMGLFVVLMVVVLMVFVFGLCLCWVLL